MFYTCLSGRVPALKKLSAAGANVNLLSPRNRLAPIHVAAREYGTGKPAKLPSPLAIGR